MRTCIYCGEDKEDKSFSHEHIWPDALGGDPLPHFWHTNDVCRKCNSMSGMFVDGSFIKSWAGSAERATGALEYLSVDHARRAIFPLDYVGKLPDSDVAEGEVAEYWAGPCGANIVHFRPSDEDDNWASYAGGDPRAASKRTKAGRAYIALTSENPLWINVSLASSKAHFNKAALFVTNMEVPREWSAFKTPDPSDATQARDMRAVSTVIDAGKNRSWIRTQAVFSLDLGNRLLAKLGLAVGYKTFGPSFLTTDYARRLRKSFREANEKKRRAIHVRGTRFLLNAASGDVAGAINWPGAWVLVLKASAGSLALSVITPSGRPMDVVISDDPRMVDGLEEGYKEGKVWLTIPSLGEAAGPISLPNYLAHRLDSIPVPELDALAAKRIDPSTLPPCW